MARSKGLSSSRIMWRHAFRPSSFSLLAAAGVNIGALIGRRLHRRVPVRHQRSRVLHRPGRATARLPGGPRDRLGGRHRLRDPPVRHRLPVHRGRPEGDPCLTTAPSTTTETHGRLLAGTQPGDRPGRRPRWRCTPTATAAPTTSPNRGNWASCSGSGIGWVAVVLFGAVFANLLPLPTPTSRTTRPSTPHPSIHHLLGTDDLGRDLLSRIIFGSRVSLIVGLRLGGHRHARRRHPGARLRLQGWSARHLLNAGSFVLLAFPAIVAVIAIVAFWGQTLGKITVILGVATIPLLYRVVRASSLSFANRDFVVAARTLGAKDSPDPLPRDPPQRGPRGRDLRAHHRGRRHRDRGLAGLPGSVGRPAHGVVGEHHLGGRVQREPELQPLHHAVAGRWPCSCCCCPSI